MTRKGTRALPTAERVEAERQALELRRSGLTYDLISRRLKLGNPGTAHRFVSRALSRTLQPAADELRKLESARLDDLQAAVWGRAMRGDVYAVGCVLKIMERRSKLLGLDAPVRAHVEVTDGITVEISRLAAQLGVADPDALPGPFPEDRSL